MDVDDENMSGWLPFIFRAYAMVVSANQKYVICNRGEQNDNKNCKI